MLVNKDDQNVLLAPSIINKQLPRLLAISKFLISVFWLCGLLDRTVWRRVRRS